MSMTEIDPRTAHATLGDFRVVDVRETTEFDGPLGAITSAENLPLRDVAKLVSHEPERLLLVCRSGKRSARACSILSERGITRVTNLEGGMIAWNRAQLPIVRRSLDRVDDVLSEAATPPDLDLTLAVYRCDLVNL